MLFVQLVYPYLFLFMVMILNMVCALTLMVLKSIVLEALAYGTRVLKTSILPGFDISTSETH